MFKILLRLIYLHVPAIGPVVLELQILLKLVGSLAPEEGLEHNRIMFLIMLGSNYICVSNFVTIRPQVSELCGHSSFAPKKGSSIP